LADLPHMPPYAVSSEGEVIILRYDGKVYRLRIDEAEVVKCWALSLAQRIYDETTRAGGIEPRSGEPL
jgi:hypothetical protein